MRDLPPVVVLSLADDPDRRAYIADHFAAVGLTTYRFEDAIAADAPEVRRFYREDLVARFPPCFRCGRPECHDANNILIPQQVANFLSFRRLWAGLADEPERLHMICEDDVFFYPGATAHLAALLARRAPQRRPLLIRLAQSGAPTDRDLAGAALQLTETVTMSNAAYILNGAMAARLTARFTRVDTTSDVWVHREMASDPEVEALTVDPLLATELSYNAAYARFASRIHPKGIDPTDQLRQKQHVKRVTTLEEYQKLRKTWEG